MPKRTILPWPSLNKCERVNDCLLDNKYLINRSHMFSLRLYCHIIILNQCDLLIKRKKKPAYIYNALAVLQNLVVVVVAVL